MDISCDFGYLLVMPLRPENLPADPARLTQMVLELDAENESLRVLVKTLRTALFGAKSERQRPVDPDQIALDLGDLAAAAAASANDNAAGDGGKPSRPPRKAAQRNMGALPRHLPRHDVVIEPETTGCPCCGGALHRIGEDISEVLDVIPAILRVLRIIRGKYGCRSCETAVIQAPAPARVMDGGMVSTALVAHVVVAKFAWHLPLYRQVQMLGGQGIVLDRSTLAQWAKRAAWWLRPLYEGLLRYIHSHARVYCDETPLPRLAPGRGRTKVCQLWAHAVDDRPWQGPAHPAVAYVFAEGRGKAEITKQLAGFEGILQVDGYAAYKGLAGPIRLAFCLAHARRKFFAVAKATGSATAQEMIDRIAEVYAIEERVRGQSAERRRAVRQVETRPIMEGLKARLVAVDADISAKSSLAGAIRYTLGHWDGLVAFLDDGRIDVDSNAVERTMRPIGLGRKNSLFAGNEEGGETWAILASLINSAKLSGLDPFTYLNDVLERIVSGRTKANDLASLLPWAWKAERAAAGAAAPAWAA